MMLFNKRKPSKEKQSSDAQVDAHKRITNQQIKEVKNANKDFNKLFDKNGFTFKIYLATGGTRPIARKT